MPAEERRALLLLGHAINEINVLQKLIMMHRRTPAPHKVVDRLEAGQALILTRVLIGKLHEAWELFKVRMQASAQLRAKYLGNQDAERRALLEKLNKHFGGGSPLTAIRNQLAFHYTDKSNSVEDTFQHLSNSEPWEIYWRRLLATPSTGRRSWSPRRVWCGWRDRTQVGDPKILVACSIWRRMLPATSWSCSSV